MIRIRAISVLLPCMVLLACVSGNNGKNLHGREKANYLVNAMGKRVHVPDAQLGSSDDRSFGEFGFHYDANRDVLTGRVFIAKAYLDKNPTITENFRKSAAALNDPKIGGLFEHAGGYFVLDEKKQKFFLMKDFPVENITPSQLWERMEDLIDLGARWSIKWVGHVGRMAHGYEPPPTHPITRQNDPYPRN